MSDTPALSSTTGASPQVSIIVSGSAQHQIDTHLGSDGRQQHGGVLVGTADPALGLVVVTAVERLPENEDSAGQVEFSRTAWTQMVDRVMERHPGHRIVGWYHSHPGSGVFLSAHDLLVHTTYFSQPWQIAYVVDPVRNQRGFFAWRSRELVRVDQWDVTSRSTGIAATVAVNEPGEGRPSVLGRIAASANPSAREAVRRVEDERRREEPHDETTVDDTDPIVRPSEDVDLDAWIASLPTAAAEPADASVSADRAEQSADDPPTGRGTIFPIKIVIVLVAVVVAAVIAIIAAAAGDSDDDKTSPPPTAASAAITPTTVAPTEPVTTVVETAAPTTDDVDETVAVQSSAPRTTVGTTVPATTATVLTVAPTVPPTPQTVTLPSARIGTGSIPCSLGPDGLYVPVANCFVPLPNGNIVADFNGSMVCADPPGTALGPATPFLVGFGGDPLAVIAGGVALTRCVDLSYARNVMIDGATTFDGLCGAPKTPLDETSDRCFAQNPATGAMVAMVSAFGTSRGLAGLCYSADAPPTLVELTWTTSGVDSTWTIASVGFDSAAQLFVATADRGASSATTTMACA